MARSTYIYVVEEEYSLEGWTFVGAWTVKHEMTTWLKRYVQSIGVDIDDLRVTRHPDGRALGNIEGVQLDVRELVQARFDG